MKSSNYLVLPLALFLSFAGLPRAVSASGGVYITEVQPNPAGPGTDNAEWLEIHNTSSSTISLMGWQVQDYVGGSDPTNVSSTGWGFSDTSSLAPGQVIIIAKMASAFEAIWGFAPTYELGLGTGNSTTTPDLIPIGGNSVLALANASTGDAVLLKDESGVVVDSVEWGTLDRDVSGTPASRPGDGDSLVRINTTGSSNVDFAVSSAPSPFVGYGTNLPPSILDIVIRPRHAVFGEQLTVSATVTDMDGIAEASVYLTTATSTLGAAIMPYQQVTMTSTSSKRYFFEAPIENLSSGLGFNEPSTFHEQFIRMFIAAEDAISTTSTWPNDATELENNENYRWRNVLPSAPSRVQAAREQDAQGRLKWKDLSVWVKGKATSAANTFRNDRVNFTVDDGTSAIAVYSFTGDIPSIADGTEVAVLGTLEQYYGLAQIVEPAMLIQVGDQSGAPVIPESVNSIADLLTNAEAFESRLVTLEDVELVEAIQVWSGDGTGGGSNYEITDGTGQISLRVWADVDLVGTNVPSGKFNLTGILSQRSLDGRNGVAGGYQMWPRTKADVTVPPPVVPDAGTPTPSPDSGVGVPGSSDSGVSATPDAGFREAPRPGEPTAVEDDGCSCQTASVSTHRSVWPLVLLMGLFWFRRRDTH